MKPFARRSNINNDAAAAARARCGWASERWIERERGRGVGSFTTTPLHSCGAKTTHVTGRECNIRQIVCVSVFIFYQKLGDGRGVENGGQGGQEVRLEAAALTCIISDFRDIGGEEEILASLRFGKRIH